MVRLTITPSTQNAIQQYKEAGEDFGAISIHSDPPLDDACVGDAISHGQVIAISKYLESKSINDRNGYRLTSTLDSLLRGSRIYHEQPPKKPQPTSEYQALMARLRREEEAAAYERMINPPLPVETFGQRFPNAGGPRLFGKAETSEIDEVTYADVNRQIALIFNVIISIVACSVALWLASKHWSVPKRLGLSMGGSGIVAIAEVVVYAGYIRRVQAAKTQSKKQVEVKEIIDTWEIGGCQIKGSAHDSGPATSIATEDSIVRKRQVRFPSQ